MGRTLVLAEKPSVAREIARVLNCTQNGNGFISGNKYIVTWALGHLVTLADPESYGNKFKTWNLEDLPMLPKKMELVVIKETSKQYGVVKGLLNRADIDELVIATDSGREGELVARWIIIKAGFKKPIKRLWISSQTDKAIKEGFAKLKPGSEYENLFKSAQSRAEADWLVGLNVTRALTCKYNAQLSAGRVQTPTLAIIIEREEEIRRFIPTDFWTINIEAEGFNLSWQDNTSGNKRIFSKEQAEKIISRIKGQKGNIIEIRKDAKYEAPPLAYDLTELQRDANRRFGYSAKQTSTIMQKLYESHKLVTYPRTDSRYISSDIVPTLIDRLKSIAIGPYAKLAQSLIRTRLNITKAFVDDTKVSDHHAIIPTEEYVDLSSLNSEERNIYDLIVKRFLAVLLMPFEYEQTSVKADFCGEIFTAKGKIVKSMGWKSVYDNSEALDKNNEDEDERDQSLPQVIKGQSLLAKNSRINNGKTKPPARYNEATLLSAMEYPGKFIENKELKDALESTSGLGTPATRADIIEKLFNSFYIERKGKDIYPTSKGIQLINLVPKDLKSPELTAKWEQQLKLISKGKTDSIKFIEDMKTYTSKMVSAVIANSASYNHDNVTREKCECGKYLLEVNGKKGKMLVCPDRECGYRKSITKTSNARCPQCHKNMEIRGDGDNKSFFCRCGHREKMDDFKKRKGDKVNKKEVSKFLNKQENNVSINTGFADAFAKLIKDKKN
jgi:DNA topoisomerase-3